MARLQIPAYPDLAGHTYSGSLSEQANCKSYYEQLLESSIGAGKTVDEYYAMNAAYLEQFFRGLGTVQAAQTRRNTNHIQQMVNLAKFYLS